MFSQLENYVECEYDKIFSNFKLDSISGKTKSDRKS